MTHTRREFSQLVKIKILKGDTDLSTIIPLEVYADSVFFNEEGKSGSSGILYEQSLRLSIDRSEATEIIAAAPAFHAILELRDNVDAYIWGDVHIPVKSVVTPMLEKCVIDFERNSPLPLIRV